MPIPNLDNESPINQYVSSSGQTEFVFSFYIFATSDIKVYVNDVLKTITTDYVVRKSDGGVIGSSDLPMDGGKIIFNVGQVAGAKISINRDIPINRYTQFVTGGDFKADAFNTELTRILAIQQQLNRDIARSFRLAPSDAEGGSLQLPTNRASNILAFDANGNLILTRLADIDKANVSPFISTLLDDTTANQARTTLGVVIGTDVQAQNTNLSALAGLTGASNKLPYFTGAGAMAVRDLLATTTTQGISYLNNPITIAFNSTTSMDFGAGNVNYDNGIGQLLCSAISNKVLQASGSWSAGSSGNGLDTGARANSTWYNIFEIIKNSDGTNDILYSTSRSSPTVPSGYTLVAWIGRIRTDASGNIDTNQFAIKTSFGQIHHYKNANFASGTSTIPFDNTIPQNTEGTEFMTTNFIPLKANTEIEIDCNFFVAISTQNIANLNALFRSGSSDALTAGYSICPIADGGQQTTLKYIDSLPNTNAVDYSMRSGGSNTSTTYFNGILTGAKFNGRFISSITIKEYL